RGCGAVLFRRAVSPGVFRTQWRTTVLSDGRRAQGRQVPQGVLRPAQAIGSSGPYLLRAKTPPAASAAPTDQNTGASPRVEPTAPNSSGTPKVDALMIVMRTPTASPMRPAGAMLCNSDITIGCGLPSARPSVKDSATKGPTRSTNGTGAKVRR